jgi:hypothetical protein
VIGLSPSRFLLVEVDLHVDAGGRTRIAGFADERAF